MADYCKEVQTEYDYSLSKYNPQTIHDGEFLSEYDVFKAHFTLADFFISTGELASYGILNFNLLSSAVARQTVGYAGMSKWTDPYAKIATLAFGLDKNHAFRDGNKRTSLLCLLLALHRMKRHLTCHKKDLEVLLVRIAANEMGKYKDFKKYAKKYGDDAIVMFIANFIKRNSSAIENSFRVMTYEEFNRKLKVYNVWLDNPNNCHIDVFTTKEEKKYFGLKTITKTVNIYQIGFPGWKRQINPKAVRSVLKEAGLTSENGIDYKTFYEGGEPEYKLIEEYFEVLKRLKDE